MNINWEGDDMEIPKMLNLDENEKQLKILKKVKNKLIIPGKKK